MHREICREISNIVFLTTNCLHRCAKGESDQLEKVMQTDF
jgi:hypothetical protein